MDKKLYFGTDTSDVLFISELTNPGMLANVAHRYLNDRGCVPGAIRIEEITEIQNIPREWRGPGNTLFGADEAMTAEEFLTKQNDPDYKLYLQLKKKFEE